MGEEETVIYQGGGGDIEAGFYEAALRDADIRCVVRSGGIAQHPMRVGPMAEFTIAVNAEDADHARQILAGLQEDQSALESEDDEPPLDSEGVFRRRLSDRDRKQMVWFSGVVLAISFWLMIFVDGLRGIGLLLLWIGLGTWAASHR